MVEWNDKFTTVVSQTDLVRESAKAVETDARTYETAIKKALKEFGQFEIDPTMTSFRWDDLDFGTVAQQSAFVHLVSLKAYEAAQAEKAKFIQMMKDARDWTMQNQLNKK